MDIEERISDITTSILNVMCRFYNVDGNRYVTSLNIYPLPQVGDIIHFTMENNDYEVVSRYYREKSYSWQDDGGWVLYAKELKKDEV